MKDFAKCEICDVILKDTNKLQPVFVSFPHGTLLAKEISRLSCTVCLNKCSKKRHVAIATEDSNVYVGSGDTLDEESHTSNVCNTYIAIHNRKTNKIRLIESDNILLSRFIEKQDALLTKDTSISDTITARDRYSNLQKSFGSKNKKRQSEQNERYKTDVNTLRDNLIGVVNTVDTTDFKEDLSLTSSTLLPRCNRLASTVDQVYQLHDIISELELDSMEQEALKVIKNIDNLYTTNFTSFFLKNVPQVMESSNRLLCVKVLLYADCILKFFKTLFKNKDTFKKACPFSPMIATKLCQEFTLESSSKSRLRPNSMRDKAMCHVIVLGLLMLNFKLDLKTVLESSSTSIKRLILLSKAVGATLANRETVIQLKLPLANPPSLASNKKGKGS